MHYLFVLPFSCRFFHLFFHFAADTKVNHVRSSGTIQIRTSGSQGDPTSIGKHVKKLVSSSHTRTHVHYCSFQWLILCMESVLCLMSIMYYWIVLMAIKTNYLNEPLIYLPTQLLLHKPNTFAYQMYLGSLRSGKLQIVSEVGKG